MQQLYIRKETLNNLYHSCNNNDNYFQRFNVNFINNFFINCYNEKYGGYFLDKSLKMSIPCYLSYKKYKGFQNEENKNCIEYYASYA